MLKRILQQHQRNKSIRAVVHRDDEEGDNDDYMGDEENILWTRLSHNGPGFDSFERTMSREEILNLYHRVPEIYRDKYFWKNFGDLCIAEGWIRTRQEARQLLNRYTPRELNNTQSPQPELHNWCIMGIAENCTNSIADGGIEERQKITTWRMEPPVVFIGRGEHPLRGCLRRRIQPEDVVINIDEESEIPRLPKNRSWQSVIHNRQCSWLWSWVDPLLGKYKYVYTAAVSSMHAEKERRKFEVCDELENHIAKIRKFYTVSMEKGEYLELSCILYLIDRLGLRIGNENNQAVDGATTLRVKNIMILNTRGMVRINFIGKDSIEYNNQIKCEPYFITTVASLSVGKSPEDYLFPNVNPRIVNSYLQSYHPDLKAKTFRTFNATRKFKDCIDKYRGGSTADAVAWFKKSATEVAIFCNHKRLSPLKRIKEQYSPTTSITNYIDPRVVYAWSVKHGVPLNKIYSKTLLERFSWAFEDTIQKN